MYIWNYVTQPLSSADISNFDWKSVTFVISRNTDTDSVLIHNFSSFNLFASLKIFLKNMVVILMMSAKLTTLSLLKLKVF